MSASDSRSVLKLVLPINVRESSIALPQDVSRAVNVSPSSVVRRPEAVEVGEMGHAGVPVVVAVTTAAALLDCVGYSD